MVKAYVVFPDVILNALDKNKDDENTIYSRSLLNKLMNEKFRVCTNESKKFRGFMSNYHWKCLLDIVINLLNNQKITPEEINLIQIVTAAFDKDGIEGYPYQDFITPLLDLAKDKSDSFEVTIVCNNRSIRDKIKKIMEQQTHFGSYPILSAKEVGIYHQ